MFNVVKIILILAILLFGSWFVARDFLPKQITDSTIGKALNNAVSNVTRDAKKVINSFEKGNYYDKIKPITAEQVGKVIQNGISRNRTMVLYIYSFDAQINFVNLSDIIDMSNKYDNNKVTFVLLALEKDRQLLADRLDKFGNNIHFTPLLLEEEHYVKLPNVLNSLIGGYAHPPYLAIVNKAGVPKILRTGLSRKNTIDREIENAIKGVK